MYLCMMSYCTSTPFYDELSSRNSMPFYDESSDCASINFVHSANGACQEVKGLLHCMFAAVLSPDNV